METMTVLVWGLDKLSRPRKDCVLSISDVISANRKWMLARTLLSLIGSSRVRLSGSARAVGHLVGAHDLFAMSLVNLSNVSVVLVTTMKVFFLPFGCR